MAFGRRVVTGPDGISADGPAPLTVDMPGGIGVTELLWLDGPARTIADGIDRIDGGFPLEPPAGGASSRIIRLAPTDGWLRVDGDADATPGMHATDTLDLVLVLDGEIVLGTADGSQTVVRAGDAVVQRGARHRWRVDASGPCTYWVTMLRPDALAPPPARALTPVAGTAGRRIVATGDGLVECPASVTLGRLYDVWHTGGPLASVTQGGDPETGWSLEMPPGNVALRVVELAPGGPTEAGWHATPTIDVDVVLSGRLGLELRGGVTAELEPGDAVIQRGTDHRWWAIGDEPVRFAAVMFALATA